jgi:predicted TIM-barrel fold metal-dependent hydrolase
MFREMDESGITKGVVVGRIRPKFEVTNDSIASVVSQYPDRLIGVAGIDVWGQYHQPILEIERSVLKLDFKGVCIEPGGNQRSMHYNDPRLYPIYAKCDELKVPVFITTAFKQGPLLNYTHPENLEPVANYFPNLKIVAAHGCYPYVMEMIGVALRCSNVFVSSDNYTYWPGGENYIKAAEHRIADQFLFASSYPLCPFKEAIDRLKKFQLGSEIIDTICRRNAERLLSLG